MWKADQQVIVMPVQAFTRNYDDNSTDAGFQFTFHCDLCEDGYKTNFIESKTYKKAGFFRGIGKAVSVGSDLIGRGGFGGHFESGTNILSEKFQGMTPEWHKEHEQAFEIAQNEAKGHFQRCPKCRKYVCESDWNEQDNLCVECAPRENVEITAARAGKMVEDIRKKADETTVFTGEIERKQTVCPQCGKPTGGGKFCNSCGAPLTLAKCPKCGAKNVAGTRFCGECGTKL
ncbi:MAG: zinc ribbon domain-containing protein [candidate division Zixibacteria bacterium]|nr:zinc ribbon domain-containing protein [candidate division Zixibacteria bacterium]